MTRNKKIGIGIAGGIIVVTIGIGVFAFQHQFAAPQKGAETEKITINLATTEAELIPKLKEQGYIRSEWAFNYVLKKKDWQGKIEPGGYMVSKGMTAWELADTLVNKPYQKWVVIPEGLRKEEIAEMVAEKLGWGEDAKENFLNNAEEGYLFPDTYLLNMDYTGKDVAKRMESQFNEKAGKVLQEFADANIKHDTAITLASLIQREAANEEEMPLIAGIIWNRLLHDPPMKLEIDATIQYIVGEPGKWWPPVKPEQYKIESPYNTYLIQGRPAAPICNPGLAAMEAVVHDQPSEYLYYLHDSEGQIHPAKTYEEHKENIEKYLKENTTKDTTQPTTQKIEGEIHYCTTACEDAHLYCVGEPTSKKTVKVQIRNPYNGNTIECYQERFPLIRTEIPILTINKEMWDELKGERIPYQVELTAFSP